MPTRDDVMGVNLVKTFRVGIVVALVPRFPEIPRQRDAMPAVPVSVLLKIGFRVALVGPGDALLVIADEERSRSAGGRGSACALESSTTCLCIAGG